MMDSAMGVKEKKEYEQTDFSPRVMTETQGIQEEHGCIG